MTLTELKYIIAVALEKNFGRAAEKCFVSQPTLSIAVKKLEEELNVTLFERQTNSVVVTPLGEKIIEQAQVVLDEANKIKALARSGRDELADELKLGAIYTVGPYLFPTLLPKLAKAAPQMPLIIEENYTNQLTKKLLLGELDMIIVALPYEHAGIETKPLFTEKLVVIIPPNHPWKNRAVINPQDLYSETVLLLGEGHCFRNDVLRACPNCAINRHANTAEEKMIEGGSLETIRHMVAAGMGISVLPESAIHAEQFTKNYFLVKPFKKPQPIREIVLAYRHGFPRMKVIELLANLQDFRHPSKG